MKRLLLTLRSYFPSKLPVGVTAFESFLDDIMILSGNLADRNSIKFALGQQIMHAPSDMDKVPMQYFVKRLKKTAANQIAANAFQEVKLAQEAKMAEDKLAADTAKEKAESDEPAVL